MTEGHPRQEQQISPTKPTDDAGEPPTSLAIATVLDGLVARDFHCAVDRESARSTITGTIGTTDQPTTGTNDQ